MKMPFSGDVLSWSHDGRALLVDVHPAPGVPAIADGPLVEWETLARYLAEGADDASGMVVMGRRGIDAGLCWASLSGRVSAPWSGLPSFVARRGTASGLVQLIDRVSAVWQTIAAFDGPTVAVVTGGCARGGFEIVGAVDRVVAEQRPGLDAELRAAGVAVDAWVAPGGGQGIAGSWVGPGVIPTRGARMPLGSRSTRESPRSRPSLD